MIESFDTPDENNYTCTAENYLGSKEVAVIRLCEYLTIIGGHVKHDIKNYFLLFSSGRNPNIFTQLVYAMAKYCRILATLRHWEIFSGSSDTNHDSLL